MSFPCPCWPYLLLIHTLTWQCLALLCQLDWACQSPLKIMNLTCKPAGLGETTVPFHDFFLEWHALMHLTVPTGWLPVWNVAVLLRGADPPVVHHPDCRHGVSTLGARNRGAWKGWGESWAKVGVQWERVASSMSECQLGPGQMLGMRASVNPHYPH